MVLSMDRWAGKLAIVTGASSGIGAAVADALVEKGLIVLGVARRSERIEERAKQLSGKKGKLHVIKADLTKEEDIVKVFKWSKDNLGPVHILVNNAGRVAHTNLTEGKTEDWKSVFDLNVLGLCIATRELIVGHQVVNYPGLNVYPASKFAVTALTETLRQELNHQSLKIKITSFSPGAVESEMSTLNPNLSPERKAALEKMPILKSEDIAHGIVYALSTSEHVQVHELTIKPVGEKV
ncbi:hypothetical protein Zmor_027105 [Zophobas morio]|uniref:Dehydrogenase/reductase SDR family member 11 n=1 Tax=Zophobas morio TaxID=2755281 RepID=A0AA38HL10_9CUCU|nr:hypothetical protein Zmor_027105 [Zophobas morio]